LPKSIITKSYAYIDASYLALVEYIHDLSSGDSVKSVNQSSIGTYFTITDQIGFLYTPLAGLALIHHGFSVHVPTKEPAIWWPKLKEYIANHRCELDIQGSTLLARLVDIVQMDTRLDPRLVAIYNFMEEILKDYLGYEVLTTSTIPINYITERIPELSLYIIFQPSFEMTLEFYIKGKRLPWHEVAKLLDQNSSRLLLLTSPHTFSRYLGRSYDSN